MRSAQRALFFAVVWTLTFPAQSPGQVQPVPLDTVHVEVNSRASPALGSGTRAVETIDARAIRNAPATTVVELLQWAFGVDLMPRSPALADVSIRGSSFEQVLVLVDGVRMRDGQTGHFNLNLAVPLDQVERIEVLRGPAASLYGSDAMAGVINIVTRRRGEGSMASISRGSYETNEVQLSHRRSIGSVHADLAATYQESEGHRPGTDYEMGSARVAVVIPAGRNPLFAEAAYASRDFGADGFYGPFPSYESTRTTTASARWRLDLDSLVAIEPLISYRRNSDDFILRRQNPTGPRNAHTTDQFGAEVIGRVTVTERLHTAFGLHAYQDEIQSSALGQHSEWTAAASAEVAAGRPEGTSGTVGLRADRQRTGSVVLSPGGSLAWVPSPMIRLRSSGGRSFRSPTWTERFYPEVGGNVGNPDLTPERAWSADAGVDLYPSPHLRLSTSAFLRNATDLIDWARVQGDVVSPWTTRNVESANFRGLETEAEFGDLMGVRLRARGAWTSLSASPTPGFESKYALRPQVENLSLSADRMLIGLVHLSVIGNRGRRLGEVSHFKMDARSTVELRGIRIWADLRNALDEKYDDISYNPAPGRHVVVGLAWRSAS